MKKLVVMSIAGLALAGCESSGSNMRQPAVNMAGPAVNMNMAGPADLSDLVDARGSSGEMQLQSRGFILARTRGLTAFWWNGSSGTCAKVVTNEGRYQSVDTVAPSECGY